MVCESVCKQGESTMFRIFAIWLFAYSVYRHAIALILIMWDYFYVFMCAGDMASCETFDSRVKR